MTKEELEQHIAQGESSTLEFKDGVASPETIAQLIASFANAEGGLVLFGVREPRQIVGVEEERLRRAVDRAKRHISGDVQTQLELTDFDGQKIGILKVEPFKGIVAAGGSYHHRIGAKSRPMSAEEIRKHLVPTKSPDAALTDLSHAVAQQTQLIEQMREDLRRANSPKKKILLTLGGVIGGQLLRWSIEYLPF